MGQKDGEEGGQEEIKISNSDLDFRSQASMATTLEALLRPFVRTAGYREGEVMQRIDCHFANQLA
jgi:hypothetical protein